MGATNKALTRNKKFSEVISQMTEITARTGSKTHINNCMIAAVLQTAFFGGKLVAVAMIVGLPALLFGSLGKLFLTVAGFIWIVGIAFIAAPLLGFIQFWFVGGLILRLWTGSKRASPLVLALLMLITNSALCGTWALLNSTLDAPVLPLLLNLCLTFGSFFAPLWGWLFARIYLSSSLLPCVSAECSIQS